MNKIHTCSLGSWEQALLYSQLHQHTLRQPQQIVVSTARWTKYTIGNCMWLLLMTLFKGRELLKHLLMFINVHMTNNLKGRIGEIIFLLSLVAGSVHVIMVSLKQVNWSHTNRLNIGRSSVPVKGPIQNSSALLKVTYQNKANAWEMLVRAWDCIEMSETHAQCVRLESSVVEIQNF